MSVRHAVAGVRLGTSWFTHPAASDRGLRLLRVLGIAAATFAVAVCFIVTQGAKEVERRGATMMPNHALDNVATFDVQLTSTPLGHDNWTTVSVAARPKSSPPPPPGAPTFPEPGQSWISPAVAQVIADDPAKRSRVPGRIMGTLRDDGLESPDQLIVYTGEETVGGWSSSAWGDEFAAGIRPVMPLGALLAILLLLVGMPALIMAWTSSSLSREARARQQESLYRLGVSRSALSWASATETFWCAATGALLGVATAGIVAIAAHRSTLLGLAWFGPATGIQPGVAAALVVVTTTLLSHLTWRATRRRVGLTAQADTTRRRSWLSLMPLLAGAGAMVGFVVPAIITGRNPSFGLGPWILFTAPVLFIVGLLWALPLLLQLLGDRMAGRARSPVSFVAHRRLSWNARSYARSSMAIVCVAFSAILVGGVVADLQAMVGQGPSQQVFIANAGGLGTEATARTLEVADDVLTDPVVSLRRSATNTDELPAAASHSAFVASCASVSGYLSRSTPRGAVTWDAACYAGATLRIADARNPTSGWLSIEGLDDSGLGEGTYRIAPVATVRASDAEGVIFAGGTASASEQIDRLAASTGGRADVSRYPSTSSFEPVLPGLERLLMVSAGLGLLLGVVLLVITLIDQRRIVQDEASRLYVLGVDRRLTATTRAIATRAAVIVAALLTVGGAWLASTTYVIVGGLASVTPDPARLMLTAGVAVAAGAAIGVQAIVTRRTVRGVTHLPTRTE